MSRHLYSQVFRRKHTLLIVIHVENEDQALRNAAIAFQNDADGVFLINHNIAGAELLDIYKSVRKQYRENWIGINVLDAVDMEDALLRIPADADGLWCDDAGISDGHISVDLYMFNRARCDKKPKWEGLFFGGVAHKGGASAKTVNPGADARIAVTAEISVITTSGPATGSAPTMDKMLRIGKAAGDHPIAIASGISAENVRQFKPYADCFLVASSVSDTFTELNVHKVRLLSAIVHT